MPITTTWDAPYCYIVTGSEPVRALQRRGPQAGQPLTEATVRAHISRMQLQAPFDRAAEALIQARGDAGAIVSASFRTCADQIRDQVGIAMICFV